MSTMKPLPKDAPVMLAWEQYKATGDYQNTRNWALKEAHVDGSLWAAFCAGFTASLTPTEAEPGEAEVERVAEAIAHARSWQTVALTVGDWDCRSKKERQPFIEMARAAIAALRSTTPAVAVDDDALVERLERVERQVMTGNGYYEAPNGKMMHRVLAADLAAITKIARAAQSLQASVREAQSELERISTLADCEHPQRAAKRAAAKLAALPDQQGGE